MVAAEAPGTAADWRTVRIGVRPDPPDAPDGIGRWLADTSALDAAGADALWVDAGPDPELDVLAVAAALAVVTFRSRLVVALPDPGAPEAALARMLDTIRRLSRGRLALLTDAGRDTDLAVLAPGVPVFRRLPDQPDDFECRDGDSGDELERWESIPAPPDRTAWRAARADAAGRGVRGLVMPAFPRLRDLLRNPDDPGQRRDLYLAQG